MHWRQIKAISTKQSRGALGMTRVQSALKHADACMSPHASRPAAARLTEQDETRGAFHDPKSSVVALKYGEGDLRGVV
jgi:hypothetical protein